MIIKLIKYFISLCYWSRRPVEKVRTMQLRKFKEVFEYAREHSKFYHDLYEKAGVLSLNIKDWADVEKVPIVDKADLRKVSIDDIMTQPDNASVVYHYTSGSTGEPFRIAQSYFEEFTSHIRVLYLLLKYGYRPWHAIFMVVRYEASTRFTIEKRIGLLGRVQKLLGLFQRKIVSNFASPEEMYEGIQQCPNAQVYWGTPGVTTILADYMENRGLVRPFKVIVLMSETITPRQYEQYKKVFKGRIINHYGCMECPTIAFGDYSKYNLSVLPNTTLVEANDCYDAAGEKRKEVVITNFINRTMPFVRYNMHDWVETVNTPEFPFLRMGHITGRVDDQLHLKCGKTFAGNQAYEMSLALTECSQYKFVQYPDGHIALRVVLADASKRQKVIDGALERWNGRFPDEALSVEFVDSLPVSKNGKFKRIEKLS